MYRQLRGADSCSRKGALARTTALIVFAWLALIAYLVILLALGVMQ